MVNVLALQMMQMDRRKFKLNNRGVIEVKSMKIRIGANLFRTGSGGHLSF